MSELQASSSYWSRLPFGECATLVNGRAYKQEELLTEGTPVLRIQNLNGGDRWYFSDLDLPPDKYCEAGDLLFAWSATFGPYKYDGPRAIFHYHIWNVVPKPILDKGFGFWLLKEITEEVKAASHGVAMPHMTKGGMEAWQIALPPLPEQRRIVAKLEALQVRSRRAREALEAVPPLLEKLRQSILAAAFRGDLTADWREKHPDVEPASELLMRIRVERRKKWEEAELAKLKAKGKAPADNKWKQKYVEPEPVDDSDLPELPDGWGWATWREVGFCQNGRLFPSAEYSDAGVKLLRPGNLHVSGELVWNDQNTRCMPSRWAAEYPDFIVRENELVMNLTAQSLKDEFLGRVCLTSAGEECLLNQRIGRLSPVAIPPKYWLWYFKSPEFRRFVDTLNTGSLIQHMFTSQIDDCVVAVMPLEEAKVLVTIVERQIGALQRVLADTEERLSMLPSLESAILSKAFRGELAPQDTIDEVNPDPNHSPTSTVASTTQTKTPRLSSGQNR